MIWYQVLSDFLTNGLRIFLGLYLVTKLLKLQRNIAKNSFLSVCVALPITVLSCFTNRLFYLIGTEILILVLIEHYLFGEKIRKCISLFFFYEAAVALWEFIISAGLGVVFKSEKFLNTSTFENMLAVWFVRMFMFVIAFLTTKTHENKSIQSSRIISGVAIAGIFGIVLLNGQNVISISDDQMIPWLIYSMLIPLAILFFSLNHQYELEKTIAQLEIEKNALLERDYQTLSNTYASNAKLFHDFHNHIDILRNYLMTGSTDKAIDYIDNLYSPIQGFTQMIWTGDEVVDYLINSKISLATSKNIQIKTNIEFPRHTNIQSVDLTTILGNLLDNAIEATIGAEENLRFINLTIRRINEMVIMKVENGCKTAPEMRDGMIQTSKSNKSLHGWGLKSVQTAVERYDGTIETGYDDHTFRAVVTLSYNAVKI